MRSGIAYGLLRVGVFAVVFALLMLVRLDLWWLWAVVAAVISLCVGYIFFGRLRDAASRNSRNGGRHAGRTKTREDAG